jgi:hypothetical protein
MRFAVRDRLRRLRALREVGAPKWIIKAEQVSLARVRYGDRVWGALHEKYVAPLVEGSIDWGEIIAATEEHHEATN